MILVNQVKIPTHAKKYITDCLDSTWISGQGKYVDLFEQNFASFVGVKYAVSTNSGTSALHLAMLALDIKNGDEVILPALTIGSCYFAIWNIGAIAVPVDADTDTYNINVDLIEQKITSKTKAIMVVHLYGQACDMDRIMEIARKYNLFVIEDVAEAHGAKYKNRMLGTFGDVSCFSFYANKLITTGEGGAVVTNHYRYVKKMRRLKNLNFVEKKRFTHWGIGYKYEMSNLEAALGIASLEEANDSIKKKKEMAEYYDIHLGNIPGIVIPKIKEHADSSYWMYAILVKKNDFGMSRDQLMGQLLKKYRIQTREFFYPPQIAFKMMNLFQDQKFPIATKLSQEGAYLPSGLGNSMKDFQKVVTALRIIHKHAK